MAKSNNIVVWNPAHDTPHAYCYDEGRHRIFGPLGHPEASEMSVPTGMDPLAFVESQWPSWSAGWGELDAGQFHPRFSRGNFTNSRPDPREVELSDTQLLALENLEQLMDDAEHLFGVVHPCAANDSAYGGRFRNLMMLACMEVEASWRGILIANGGVSTNDRPTTNQYVKLAGPMQLEMYKVELRRFPSYGSIAPFAGWTASNPTRSLGWYDAYNSVKHDRENQLKLANLRNMINSIAAVLVMYVAQFGYPSFELSSRRTFRLKQMPNWAPNCRYYPPPTDQLWNRIQFIF